MVGTVKTEPATLDGVNVYAPLGVAVVESRSVRSSTLKTVYAVPQVRPPDGLVPIALPPLQS